MLALIPDDIHCVCETGENGIDSWNKMMIRTRHNRESSDLNKRRFSERAMTEIMLQFAYPRYCLLHDLFNNINT